MSGDRISYSFGMKLTTVQYESANFNITYTSDVKSEEELEEAFKRVRAFVHEKAEEEHDGIRKGE